MTSRIPSKEILAKLMAAENILVEHTNIPTAAFDLVNRRLLLPNWKDISDNVYTLLISHEVGHALYTPTQEWETQIINAKDFALKQVVNIVEDVRIEKLIQQKYPGTLRAFRAGYDELEKINLFGTKGKEISSYGFLDRLNIHFKLGHFGYANVPFSDKEKPWLDKISSCKSFSDVLKVSSELKQFVEENPESQGQEQEPQESSSGLDENEMTESSSENVESGPDGNNSHNQSNQESSSEDNELPGNNSNKKQTKDESDDTNNQPDNFSEKKSKVESKTQQHFDSELQKFVDDSINNTTYVNLPKIDLNALIVPYKKVHEQITSYYSGYFPHVQGTVATKIQQFKNNSKNVVNQLANIFEMKKKANLYVKSLVSSTGKLDTNKIHSYRYSDDIFKKLTVVPQGKSHGLVMFIDMSSSMYDSISGTFDQLLNLVLFCRRVSIPFDVYGFTDSHSARGDMPNHKSQTNDLTFDSRFCLRQYFSSKMTSAEFNQALGNVICIMEHYAGRLYAGLPTYENLNTTPLIPAIMCAMELVKKFRKENSLDIVNTIFLSDGEDTHGLLYNDGLIDNKSLMGNYYCRENNKKNKNYVRDLKTKKQWLITNPTSDMLNILRETAGVKVIGFQLVPKSRAQMIIVRNSKISDQEKKLNSFKNLKFCELTEVPGYDAYYLLPGGNSLNVNDDEFQTHVDTTIDWDDEKQAKKAMRAVQKDFNNFMKQKVTSRILLNRFIEQIS